MRARALLLLAFVTAVLIAVPIANAASPAPSGASPTPYSIIGGGGGGLGGICEIGLNTVGSFPYLVQGQGETLCTASYSVTIHQTLCLQSRLDIVGTSWLTKGVCANNTGVNDVTSSDVYFCVATGANILWRTQMLVSISAPEFGTISNYFNGPVIGPAHCN